MKRCYTVRLEVEVMFVADKDLSDTEKNYQAMEALQEELDLNETHEILADVFLSCGMAEGWKSNNLVHGDNMTAGEALKLNS